MKHINLDKFRTISIKDRKSKVSIKDFSPVINSDNFEDFILGLPNMLAAKNFKEIVNAILKAHHNKKQISVMMGAHVIKCGLSLWIIELMKKGVINSIAMNGAGIIHDTEIALFGVTSEDVETNLKTGDFGNAKETADFISSATQKAASENIGLGESVGQKLLTSPNVNYSILANAVKLKIPVTVHVSIGSDIIHQHPNANGADIGKASYNDFKKFIGIIADLEGGVLLNFGSAVVLPETFLKALNAARNLGFKVDNFTAVNFDMLQQYRQHENVTKRPVTNGGTGYNITGHHEIMIPLLAKAILIKPKDE